MRKPTRFQVQAESGVEKTVIKWAEERNILHLKLNVMSRRGWPDRVFWLPGGRPVLIEFKAYGLRPRPLQAHVIGLLTELGYAVIVADTVEKATKFLTEEIAKRSFK